MKLLKMDELLTVVDGNDVVLGFSTREDIQRRGLNYRCVQVFVFNGEKELLICKRPTIKKGYPGMWAASAMGRVRRGESYEDAAHRELREELGIDTKLNRATKFSVMDGVNRVFQEIYSGSTSANASPDKTEVSEWKFINLRDLKTDMVLQQNKYAPPFAEAVRAYMKAKNIY